MTVQPPDPAELLQRGLSADQVAQRVNAKLTNYVRNDSSRSITAILRSNLFTLFNAVLGSALVVVLLVGDPKDALFGFIVVANVAIGVVQEYRAKRTLDKLAVLHAPLARVLRDGVTTECEVGEVVLDDVMVLRTGDQIPADGVILRADGLDVDESLLTGESDPVIKNPDDVVRSGSTVVAGSALARATAVGADAYASRLTAEAKRFSLVHSEIRTSVNRIIFWVTWALIPIILLVVNGQMQARGGWGVALANGSWRQAVVSAVASVVAMIPEGLVLLTSISFGLAAVTLARRQVLVQELPAVEGLARVNMVCLDKTGTLTHGTLVVDGVALLSGAGAHARVLADFAADPQANATAAALASRYAETTDTGPDVVVGFKSSHKWSSLTYHGGAEVGQWVLGAPEMVLDPGLNDHAEVLTRCAAQADAGLRALVLVRSTQRAQPVPADQRQVPQLPRERTPVAILTFKEQVREDAAATLRYFREQGVTLKIVSGDNPRTVAAVAREVGFADVGVGYDARNLPADPEQFADIVNREAVLGRVTPEQKKQIVLALQRRGHVVAMTGDGVNDALALKYADIGVAMGQGADATKAVSRLVLLDGKFSQLPFVVAEGRRIIANVERVANLFLTKTTYAVAISLVIGLLLWRYPFLPRHLSLVSSLTIGIPAFFLALLPNKRRYQRGFLRRVLMFSVPAGVIISACILGVYGYARAAPDAALDPIAQTQAASTATTMALLAVALWTLSALARPFDRWRALLVGCLIAAVALILLVPAGRDFFALQLPTGHLLAVTMGVVVLGCAAIEVLYRWLRARGAVSMRE